VAPSTEPLVVLTDKGLVQGVEAGSGFAFLGIPFAEPPIGALRFEPPQPAACFSGVVDATHFGSSCAQWNPQAGGVVGSEDCLTLNVWTPALPSSSSKPLPVLVWMYGGGDLIGNSNLGATNGQALANTGNAVVVSFNYRVGALGFLAHPALTASSPHGSSGNYGLLDALLALQWVQTNIAAFGGDSTHVMLFGQSAGAINTCALVASPLAHGLFTSAVMESGNCAAEPYSDRYATGGVVAASVGCASAPDVVRCLQSVPMTTLVQNAGATYVGSVLSQVLTASTDAAHIEDLPFGPTVDGYVLEATPEATIQAGAHNHVPLIIGTNAQEFAAFIPPNVFPQGDVASCATYAGLAAVALPDLATPLLEAYPCNPLDPTSGYRQLVAVVTDAFFTCSSRRALRAAASTQSEPVYRYQFTHGGARHGAEVMYVFGSFPSSPSSAESALSQQMQSYWVNLAATGSPNGAGLPAWRAYAPAVDNALLLDTPIGDAASLDATGCGFWDAEQQ
jgi:para-nitrobenzyl esterase